MVLPAFILLPALFGKPVEGSNSQSPVIASTPGGCVSAPTGLISWWRGEGSAVDQMGANNGSNVTGVPFDSGQVGQSFGFNGTSNVVRVPNSSSLNPQNSFTIEGWIFPAWTETETDFHSILSKWDSSTRSWTLVAQGTQLIFAISNANHELDGAFHSFMTPAGVLALNQWNHVAAVYDQSTGTRSIYVNGVEQASRTDASITVSTSTEDVGVGGRFDYNGANDLFKGNIDEISFYNLALSADQLHSIVLAGVNGKCIGSTFQVSGKISDSAGSPIQGVTVSDGAGHSTVTDAAGLYLISGLGSATYILSPVLSGMTFSPSSQTVTIPPSAANVNFTGILPAAWGLSFTAPSPLVGFKAMLEYNGKLYAAGSSNSQTNGRLYAFDGSAWADTGFAPSGVSVDLAEALAVLDGKLFVGVRVNANGMPSARVYAYDGSSFTLELTAPAVWGCSGIESLTVHDGKLYAADGACGNGYVYQRNGPSSWSQLGSMVESGGAVRSLASYNGNLYAGTSFGASGAGLFRWNGSSWELAFDLATTYPGKAGIRRLAVYNNKMYVGFADGGTTNPVPVYDGATWSTSYTIPGTSTSEVVVAGGKLWATSHSGHAYLLDNTTWSDTGSLGEPIQEFAAYSGYIYVSVYGSGKVYRMPLSTADTLLTDNFSGDLSKWAVTSGTWKVVGGRLQGVGAGGQIDGYVYAGETSWTDYTLSTKVYFDNGEADLIVRSTGHWQNEYRFTLWYPGTYELIKYQGGVATHITGNIYDTSPVAFTNPSDVRVEAAGGQFKIYINGTLMVDTTDPSPLLAGRVGLGVIWNYQVHYDDVLVTGKSTAGEYSIAGQVLLSDNNSLAGVNISDDAGHTAVTDQDGKYTITGLPGGTYSLTPSKTGYTFKPSILKVVVGPNSSGQDFKAALLTAGIHVSVASGFDQLKISWTPSINPLITRYRLSRASPTASSPFTPIIYSSEPFFYDATGLSKGQNYCYQVEALNIDALLESSDISCAAFGEINVWVPESFASVDGTLIVPVNIRNAVGLSIASADIWMDFDPAVLEVLSVSSTSMTVDFVWDSYLDNSLGEVKISTISSPAKTIYGDGSLFWLTFKVKGVVGETSNLDLREFVDLVGGSSIQTENALGLLADIPLTLTDGKLTVQTRGKLGDVDDNGVVAAADALLTLKMAVGTITPTSKQLYCADVNGDGTITSADVSMILYYAVHSTWPLPPTSVTAPVARANSQSPVIISLDDLNAKPGSTVTTTLRAKNLVNWAGGDWIITYDPTQIAQVSNVTVTGLAAVGASPLAFKDDGNGRIRISIARNTSLSGDGALFVLTLKLTTNATSGTSPLTLAGTFLSDPYGRDFVTSALQGTIERQNSTVTIQSVYNLFVPVIRK
jgi:hypothetical protein